jgi:sugar lactone lactonase YvrE
LVVGSALVAVLAGCGGGGAHSTGAGGSGAVGGSGGAGGGGVCPSGTGTGTLAIQITGTPSGTGLVTIQGGPTVTASGNVTGPAGPASLTAFIVAEGTSAVRLAYTPTIDVAMPCVRAGQTTTVNVSYTDIATSGRLWVGASNAPASNTLLGFDPGDVAVSGSALAAIAADTAGSDGFTFDVQGNAWVIGATTADPPVARYPASSLATSGVKTPDVVIDSPSFGAGIPGAKVLAFDHDGNLWVSVVAADKVVAFTPGQIASSSTPTAAVEETNISAPAGIAFDSAGNMWVAANGDGTVVRIDAAHLTSSGSGADLTIHAQTPGPVFGSLSSPLGIAFDGAGNLWVNYDGTVAALTPTDQAGVGTKTVTPAIQIVLDVQSLPYGIAFDELGGMWLADRQGRFACLGASQLTASGTVTPDIIISSSDLGSAGWFAVYPAPAFTPLAHALP